MTGYHKSGDIVDVPNGSGVAISVGAIVVVGRLVGVAVNEILDGETGPVRIRGAIKVPKDTANEWTQGQVIYVDTNAEVFTTAAAGNVVAGSAFAAATESSDMGIVLLNEAGHVSASFSATGSLETVIDDPGDGNAIPVDRSGSVSFDTAASETNTLGAPTFIGQQIALSLDVDGGDRVVTASGAVNQAGNTVITFNDAGDFVLLHAVQVAGSLAWRVAANDGVTLS